MLYQLSKVLVWPRVYLATEQREGNAYSGSPEAPRPRRSTIHYTPLIRY
jgi:hypothetical protein